MNERCLGVHRILLEIERMVLCVLVLELMLILSMSPGLVGALEPHNIPSINCFNVLSFGRFVLCVKLTWMMQGHYCIRD